MRIQQLATVTLIAAATAAAPQALGQSYPTKTVRIVTTAAGGGTDLTSRLIAQAIGPRLAQQVIIDNRASIVSMETVSKATPDGYTLLMAANSMWLLPFLRKNVPWDPIQDFSPISAIVTAPNMLVVHSSLPVKTVRDLIALAKSRPGELNYGSSVGGSTHLAAELFKSLTGVNIVPIHFRGNGPAMTALISGEVQLAFPTFGAGMPHVKSGRLRAVAIASAKPSALLPGIPTIAATVPGYECGSLYGLFAPANTPQPIVKRLHDETVKALATPDLKDRFFKAGFEIVASTPEEFAAMIKTDMKQMGKVIRDAGIAEGK